MMFDNAPDAHSRLVGTIVMYDGKAMMVRNVDEEIRLHGHLILSGEGIVCDQLDERLNLVCPSLGYINSEEDSHYFMRRPVRRWKQGVDSRAMSVRGRGGIRARGILNDRNIAMCLENSYPNFDTALGMFSTRNPFKDAERIGVAFSKVFCIKRGEEGHLLEFKGREVGVVENGKPLLFDKNFWLNELLEDSL